MVIPLRNYVIAALIIQTACGVNETIISREGWSARPPKSISSMTTPVSKVVIHHTGGKACYTQSWCRNRVKEIQDFHMDSRRYVDIGYNFLAGGDGNVYEGRGWNHVGAYRSYFIDKSIGIAFIGDFTKELPNQSARSAVLNLIEYGIKQCHLTSDVTVLGHKDAREQAFSACPGARLYESIQQWSRYSRN